MKAKNIKLYKERFSHLSDDIFERIKNFIDGKRFTKTDSEKFYKALDEFREKKPKRIKLVFHIIPEQTPRPRFVRGHVYVSNSKENNNYMKAVIFKGNEDLNKLITGACSFKVNCYMPIPVDWSKVDKILAELGIIRPTGKPDWDNLGKTYSDMIQPWIISDDSNIVDGECHKYYSLKPRVEITLEY